MLKLLFGGSFGTVQAVLIGLLSVGAVWIWQDYKGAKADVERLTKQVTTLETENASKDNVISSLGNSAARRETDSQKAKDLGDAILQAKDGYNCVNSDPLWVVLDGLRDNAAQSATEPADTPF